MKNRSHIHALLMGDGANPLGWIVLRPPEQGPLAAPTVNKMQWDCIGTAPCALSLGNLVLKKYSPSFMAVV